MSLDLDPGRAEPEGVERPPRPWRDFELIAGATYYSTTSTVTFGRGGGQGSLEIDAEGVLGLNRQLWSPEVWMAVRLAERHRLCFGFEDMTRSATRTLQRDLEVNGVTYTVGTTVDSVYGVQFFNLTYAWSFLQDERMELALTLGFDTLRAHLAVQPNNGQVSTNERLILPVPLPGVNADFVLIPDLWLRERLQFMYVPVQNYSGLLINLDLALEYSFVSNVALGLGMDLRRIELEKESGSTTLGDFDGTFKFNGAGLLLYLNLHF